MGLRLVGNSRIGGKCLASFVLSIPKVIEGVSHALPFFYFHRFTLGIPQECSEAWDRLVTGKTPGEISL
jgi:hypothetical protein